MNGARIVGNLLLVFSGINLLLASLWIVLHKSIQGNILILSFVITSIILLFLLEKEKRFTKQTVIYLVLFVFIVLGAVKISEQYYDFSYDGQMYHQEAIVQLKDGWNPLYEKLVTGETQDLWINHYAKGTWYLGAILYDFTGQVESSKAFNIILLCSTFLLLSSYLFNKLKSWKWSLSVSILAVFSPVVVTQMYTSYNDFFIAILIIILIIGYLEYFETKSKIALLNILFSNVLLVNIKFTALGYAVILTGIPILLYLYNRYRLKITNSQMKIIPLILTMIVSFSLAIFFVGSATYIKNTTTNGHPFYPLAGEGKVDVITVNTPPGLEDLNRIEKLYVSIFSKTYNGIEEKPQTKFPLSITKEELEYFKTTDTRVNGFGPLFGLIIIMTIALILSHYKQFKNNLVFLFIIVSVVMLSVLINPETWWARYIPQFWFVPLIFVILLLKNQVKSYLSYAILIVYGVNVMMIGYVSVSHLQEIQTSTEQQYETIKEYSKTAPVDIEFGIMKSKRALLQEHGIEYTEVTEVNNCENMIHIVGSTVKACLEKNSID
ncbi:hypothetical protein [Lysinibacillus xylanilyticus]|uniref:hypothetical protein n=1 Tax=Lysinibacillus xylanilyticus TaxID=582475 RepID=UPI003D0656A9